MRHNDYDIACVKWHGDRSPARNRNWRGRWKPYHISLRQMNGKPSMLNQNRCLICNQYSETEANELLDQTLSLV